MFLRDQAFTLIELLIVVAIIAILAALAVPNFLEAQTRSKISRCQNDLRAYTFALEAYRVDHNQYPPVTLNPVDPGYHTHGVRPQLTTPIAYMTSTPRDIFNPAKWGPDFVYYYFWSEPPSSPEMLIGGTNPSARIMFAGLSPRLARWMLMSEGPDQIYEFDRWSNWNHQVLYDPSNGTVSAGDLVRLGP